MYDNEEFKDHFAMVVGVAGAAIGAAILIVLLVLGLVGVSALMGG